MKRPQAILLGIVLALIATTAVGLTWLKAKQKLGQPGIKFTPNPGSVVVNIDLPGEIPDFIATTNLPQEKVVLDYLPDDTSFARRDYINTNGLPVKINANIVLQGADRTSIHKPDSCLPGQGWTILDRSVVPISIGGPNPYELSVSKWTVRNVLQMQDGSKKEWYGLYVFWFVADEKQTPDYAQRNRWLIRDMFFTGVLERWAYVTYFTLCEPGHEDAAFEVVKKLIAASVPEFQAPPKTAGAATVAKQ